MKKILFTFLLLSSCSAKQSGESPFPASTPAQSRSALEIFDDSIRASETQLFTAASAALKAGVWLGGARAERCWKNEPHRPQIQATCLLLWAGGLESSPALEAALEKSMGNSRLAALAAIARKTPVAKLDSSAFLTFLQILREDRAGIRAAATLAWLEGKPSLSLSTRDEISAQLAVAEDASPGELAAVFTALFGINPAAWQSELAGFCKAGSKGSARLRCWRLIGSLADAAAPPDMAQELIVFVPAEHEEDWKFFRRRFPALAIRIQKYLNRGNFR